MCSAVTVVVWLAVAVGVPVSVAVGMTDSDGIRSAERVTLGLVRDSERPPDSERLAPPVAEAVGVAGPVPDREGETVVPVGVGLSVGRCVRDRDFATPCVDETEVDHRSVRVGVTCGEGDPLPVGE